MDLAMDRTVLSNCHDMFRQLLDIPEIIPHLAKYDLLTDNDKDKLTNQQTSRSTKIDYVMQILPRKGSGWFEKLINALRESSRGTGSAHIDLVLALRSKKAAAKGERVPDRPSLDNKSGFGHPSKIADETSWPTEKSNLTGDDLQPAKPGLASSASPSDSTSQKERTVSYENVVDDLRILEKTYLTLQNQIRLVSLYESLIRHMKTFRDALIVLQSFYVETFRNHGEASQMNETQVKMASMIENIIGYDKNFELGQEIDKWNKYLELLECNCAKTKDALFSLDNNKIKQQQLQLRLEDKDKEEFSGWIKERNSFVKNGEACFNELVKLTDVKTDPNLIDDIKIRMRAGKKLLDLWKEWMDLRASLLTL